jgi:hypothetical protein
MTGCDAPALAFSGFKELNLSLTAKGIFLPSSPSGTKQ